MRFVIIQRKISFNIVRSDVPGKKEVISESVLEELSLTTAGM